MNELVTVSLDENDVRADLQTLSPFPNAVSTIGEENAAQPVVKFRERDIEQRIAEFLREIEKQNQKVLRATSNADAVDLILAATSGVLTALIDIVFSGDFSLDQLSRTGQIDAEKFVLRIAKLQKYEKKDVKGAIKYLEEKFPLAADKATSAMGGGLQHHLRDFSHHPTPVGLFCSLLSADPIHGKRVWNGQER